MVFELHPTGRFRKQSVVFSETNVEARFKTTPTLSYKNGSALDDIAIVTFNAKSLGLTVSAVP